MANAHFAVCAMRAPPPSSLVISRALCYIHPVTGCDQDEYPPDADREWGAPIETPLAHQGGENHLGAGLGTGASARLTQPSMWPRLPR